MRKLTVTEWGDAMAKNIITFMGATNPIHLSVMSVFSSWASNFLSSVSCFENTQGQNNGGSKYNVGQNGDFTSQKLHLLVMLTSHVMLRWSPCLFLNKQLSPQM